MIELPMPYSLFSCCSGSHRMDKTCIVHQKYQEMEKKLEAIEAIIEAPVDQVEGWTQPINSDKYGKRFANVMAGGEARRIILISEAIAGRFNLYD